MLIKVCNFFELPDLKPVKFKVNNKEVILVRINDKVYATEPECPHKGGSLEYSDINAELKRIRCHLHGYEFNLENGKLEYNPYAERSEPWFKCRDLKVYKTKVIDGIVYIDLEE